ncbi:DNA topoisomerase 6 subunit B [Platanthera guangdongensis]|uniref:DNA topoisomerase 6 subunit B n=1 Tax=Platanthera guangdongensis TaxID=2320717 RepID=A0ABR2MUJ4_9ASPA
MDDNGIGDSPEEPKKGKSKTPKKAKDSVLKQKSPAEFFAENKNIAGFDNVRIYQLILNSIHKLLHCFRSPSSSRHQLKNSCFFLKPGKSLYTTVRELVENSLDSAESIKVLPSIEVAIMTKLVPGAREQTKRFAHSEVELSITENTVSEQLRARISSDKARSATAERGALAGLEAGVPMVEAERSRRKAGSGRLLATGRDRRRGGRKTRQAEVGI